MLAKEHRTLNVDRRRGTLNEDSAEEMLFFVTTFILTSYDQYILRINLNKPNFRSAVG